MREDNISFLYVGGEITEVGIIEDDTLSFYVYTSAATVLEYVAATVNYPASPPANININYITKNQSLKDIFTRFNYGNI